MLPPSATVWPLVTELRVTFVTVPLSVTLLLTVPVVVTASKLPPLVPLMLTFCCTAPWL